MTTSRLKKISLAICIVYINCIACQFDTKAQTQVSNTSVEQTETASTQTEIKHPSKKIKLALLLDTSNSMDGLIEQAKSQLWGMVNKLADAKCDNLRPTIEIALYEYGNDHLNAREGFIRLVTPLTENLDQLSEDLFGLTPNGGSEHCGQVIATSLNQLKWSESSEDLQVIFIAGNEAFTQGPVDFNQACKRAKDNNVIINTIFCGSFQEGIDSYWKDGAMRANGEYMSIDHNSKTVYISSPYDDEIANYNSKLNDTYLYYGKAGVANKEKQVMQDANAKEYGTENIVNRIITKSKHVYKNSSWDLVDAAKSEDFEVAELEEETLSEEMKDMNIEERKAYIAEKAAERASIQKKINELGKKRAIYIAEKQNENDETKSLDNALLSAISQQAKAKRFEF